MISIDVLGELTVRSHGEDVPLPASKKTRALLAFLLLTHRPHRRDRLCEMFWDTPDDPRAALRWSLTKIRRLVHVDDQQLLVADRERVLLSTDPIALDLTELTAVLNEESPDRLALERCSNALREPLLDGLDMPNHPLFQRWLTAERDETRRLQAQAARKLIHIHRASPEDAFSWAKEWLDLEPYSIEAADSVLTLLGKLQREPERAKLHDELRSRFTHAGIEWSSLRDARPSEPAKATLDRELLHRQKIQFCSAEDGAKIAYASVGQGPPIIKAANWLSHLELDWDAPIWSPLFRELARDHHFIRYDERGNGLSDWEVDDLSFEAFVRDLETVVDATEVDRFALLGISQGAAVSIEYAARHPERVSHLILFGGYPAGWRVGATPEMIREREAVMTLTASGWGRDNPAYRQIFSSTFMPGATAEQLAWFNDFQRRTTSPENAVRFLQAFGEIDVRHRLEELDVPTLVIHSLGDRRIPVETGRELAAKISGAEFVGLDTDGHLLLGDEPAADGFVQTIRRFLAGT
ncbi:MAG: alpha/beta fold hydrolase [Myxococcota bacterium]